MLSFSKTRYQLSSIPDKILRGAVTDTDGSVQVLSDRDGCLPDKCKVRYYFTFESTSSSECLSVCT